MGEITEMSVCQKLKKQKIFFTLILTMTLFCTSCKEPNNPSSKQIHDKAQPPVKKIVPDENLKLWYRQPAQAWTQALPVV